MKLGGLFRHIDKHSRGLASALLALLLFLIGLTTADESCDPLRNSLPFITTQQVYSYGFAEPRPTGHSLETTALHAGCFLYLGFHLLNPNSAGMHCPEMKQTPTLSYHLLFTETTASRL